MFCNEKCVENCRTDSGHCLQGCKPGWKGEFCDKDDETCDAENGHCPNGCEDGYSGEKCDSQPLSSTFVIVIVVVVLLVIGLISSLAWTLRLQRAAQMNIRSIDRRENSLPPTHFPQHLFRHENTAQRADSVIYDEINENVEYETIMETNLETTPQLEGHAENSVVVGQKMKVSKLDQGEGEDGYLVAHSAIAGPSGTQPRLEYKITCFVRQAGSVLVALNHAADIAKKAKHATT
ncbi:hypothetical protein B566_EDAN015819 [Ephemera danica]|nr:hypothetical protein B566_EDAN015819 [Ephemera danica]